MATNNHNGDIEIHDSTFLDNSGTSSTIILIYSYGLMNNITFRDNYGSLVNNGITLIDS